MGKFCERCGSELKKIEYGSKFNAETGEKEILFEMRCSKKPCEHTGHVAIRHYTTPYPVGFVDSFLWFFRNSDNTKCVVCGLTGWSY